METGNDLNVNADPADIRPDTLSEAAFLEGAPDGVSGLEAPPPARPELPHRPDGSPDLSALEDLCSTALDLAAEGRNDPAQDHLFTLQALLNEAAGAGTDSLYDAHLASLERRTWLLAGLLAEQEAFAGEPAAADSLLEVGYGRIGSFDFPDSLRPATGVMLEPIQADLLKVNNQAVGRWVNYFSGRAHRNFQIWLDRVDAADSLVTAILDEADLPHELIYLAMIESGLNPRAVSSASAVGPWQFMAGTAKHHGLRRSWWFDERRDLELSTRAAAKYLSRLYDQFEDWALVLAAYNSGENRVEMRIRQHGHDNFWDLRLPSQTTAYVPKFIAAVRIAQDRQKYGFVYNRPEPLRYDTLHVDDATDLGLIARCAGVEAERIERLNAALLRGATPAGVQGYPVRVPAGTAAEARRKLARVPADERLTWRRHKVRRGQTLGQIARDYGTSVTDIARLNHLGNVHLIRPGDQLLIPMPAELASRAALRAAEKGHYVPPAGWQRVSYKVRSGDTLGGIARKLRVTVKHLRRVNALPRSDLIHPGQRLYAYRPAG